MTAAAAAAAAAWRLETKWGVTDLSKHCGQGGNGAREGLRLVHVRFAARLTGWRHEGHDSVAATCGGGNRTGGRSDRGLALLGHTRGEFVPTGGVALDKCLRERVFGIGGVCAVRAALFLGLLLGRLHVPGESIGIRLGKGERHV